MKTQNAVPTLSPAPKLTPVPKPKKKKVNRSANGEGSLFQRGMAWYFKIRWNGERLVFPTGTRIKSEAIDWKQTKLAELRNGGAPVEKPKASAIVINELLDDYVAFLKLKGRK